MDNNNYGFLQESPHSNDSPGRETTPGPKKEDELNPEALSADSAVVQDTIEELEHSPLHIDDHEGMKFVAHTIYI